jgi:hypothetical protein
MDVVEFPKGDWNYPNSALCRMFVFTDYFRITKAEDMVLLGMNLVAGMAVGSAIGMNKAAKAASPVIGAEQEKTNEANLPRLTRAVYGAGGPGVCIGTSAYHVTEPLCEKNSLLCVYW